VPAAAALAPLRDLAIFPNINRADYAPTIYPPAAQFFFLAVTRLGETVTAMRLALIGCELVTLAVLIDLLRLFKKPVALAVAYAWHPLAVWEVANDGHVDALMTALIMLGVWMLVRQRRPAAAAAMMLAALVKPYALAALPTCWRPWDWRVPATVCGVGLACYLPYLSAGKRVFGFLGGYVVEEGLRDGDGFWLVLAVRTVFGAAPGLFALYLALAATTLIVLALRASFRRSAAPESMVGDVAVLLVAALFFLSPNYPWYYLVLVPFIPFRPAAPAWTLTLGSLLLHLSPGCEWACLAGKTALNGTFLIAVLAGWAGGLWARRAAG